MIFAAKLLLFGEYGVILGGEALAIPYPTYYGQFKWTSEKKTPAITASQQTLKQFADYTQQLQTTASLSFQFDTNQLRQAVHEGLYFDSNIPQGYGVGSSGALVAALYQKFVRNKITATDSASLIQLKQQLGLLESYFHGKSSGFDPLVCFVKQPILQTPTAIHTVQLPPEALQHTTLFLINTQIARQTGTFVSLFLQNCKDASFHQLCKIKYIPFQKGCIDGFRERNEEQLWNNMETLSHFQWQYMRPFIPPSFQAYWQKGLETGDFYLKICGAGGGGFMLGITKDWGQTKQYFKQVTVESLVFGDL